MIYIYKINTLQIYIYIKLGLETGVMIKFVNTLLK